jgi:hypothetical protein
MNWVEIVSQKAPAATARGWVNGSGRFVLTSCPVDGVRKVFLFESVGARNRQIRKWEEIGNCPAGLACYWQHGLDELKADAVIPKAAPEKEAMKCQGAA